MSHWISETYLLNKREAKRQFRDYIFEVWRHKCAYCGAENPCTLDHIKPRSKGGTTNTYNLLPACPNCNRNKGSKEVFSWFRTRRDWTAKREADIHLWINQHSFEGSAGIPLLAIADDDEIAYLDLPQPTQRDPDH